MWTLRAAAALRIKVELPEIKREDLKVIGQNSTLMISGQRTIEKEEKGRQYHRVERAYYGHFARSFTLPEDSTPRGFALHSKTAVECASRKS